jgi:anti-sigma factor RsiW
MQADDNDDRKALFNTYVDGEMSDDEVADFERRLDDDPDLRADYEEFESFVDDLQDLPCKSAPDGFADDVRDKIRRRSHGRFFAPDNLTYARRPPQELAAVAMLVIMASAYLAFGLSMDRTLDGPAETRLEVPPSPTDRGS